MPIPTNDHEALIAMSERLNQHQRTIDQLDGQGRDHTIQLTRIGTNVEGLQKSHELLMGAIEGIKQQQLDLDNRMDSRNTDLRDHFDEKFEDMRHDMSDTMAQKEAAVPQWAQVRLTTLSIIVAVFGIMVAVLGYYHVL